MRTQSPDTDLQAEQVHIALLRRASSARRLFCLRSLSRNIVRLGQRALARTHPELTRREIVVLFAARHYPGLSTQALKKAADREEPMPEPNILTALQPVIGAFEQLGVRHYIGGSVASSAHGVPRATLDVDLVADLHPPQAGPLVALLEAAYYADEDMIREAIARHGSFNLIHLDSMLKVDVFVPQQDAYQAEALHRRRKDVLAEEPDRVECYLASVEDIVLSKLNWFRLGGGVSEQQWRDVLGVLKVQADTVDIGYLRKWAGQLHVLDLLEMALEDAGLSVRLDDPADGHLARP